MEEIEIPTEHLHEEIKEKTSELLEKGESKSFLYIAVSTALMAVFAAIAGLMAGHHSNEALIDQIRASDQWAYYQAKSIKREVRSLQNTAASASPDSLLVQKAAEAVIAKKAEEYQASSERHLSKHVWLAGAVTLFQVAIAVSAIAIMSRKKWLWLAGIALALGGIVLFISGLV
jgi:hypothetical protein